MGPLCFQLSHCIVRLDIDSPGFFAGAIADRSRTMPTMKGAGANGAGAGSTGHLNVVGTSNVTLGSVGGGGGRRSSGPVKQYSTGTMGRGGGQQPQQHHMSVPTTMHRPRSVNSSFDSQGSVGSSNRMMSGGSAGSMDTGHHTNNTTSGYMSDNTRSGRELNSILLTFHNQGSV